MEPLIVLDHIPKTGGWALREVAGENYGPGEFVNLEQEVGGIQAARKDLEGYLQRTRDYYGALPRERKARLRCVAGYGGPLVIASVKDRPVRAFCMLREPVDYVVSYYLFQRWRTDHGGDRTPMITWMRERGWGLKEVYERLGEANEASFPAYKVLQPLFNGQARHLLFGMSESEIPFRADGERLDEYRDRALALLEETYVVGTQDRFSESIRLFADSFGWRRPYLPHANVGRLRGGPRESEIDEETLALIRSYNGIDAELHERYSARLSDLPSLGRLTDIQCRARVRTRRGLSKLKRRALRLRI